jgi:hypothetical protein
MRQSPHPRLGPQRLRLSQHCPPNPLNPPSPLIQRCPPTPHYRLNQRSPLNPLTLHCLLNRSW